MFGCNYSFTYKSVYLNIFFCCQHIVAMPCACCQGACVHGWSAAQGDISLHTQVKPRPLHVTPRQLEEVLQLLMSLGSNSSIVITAQSTSLRAVFRDLGLLLILYNLVHYFPNIKFIIFYSHLLIYLCDFRNKLGLVCFLVCLNFLKVIGCLFTYLIYYNLF